MVWSSILDVMLLKIHCELNHIEYFWANAKRDRYNYSLEGLRIKVFESLTNVKSLTIFGHYKGYLTKMDLYWDDRPSHQKQGSLDWADGRRREESDERWFGWHQEGDYF